MRIAATAGIKQKVFFFSLFSLFFPNQPRYPVPRGIAKSELCRRRSSDEQALVVTNASLSMRNAEGKVHAARISQRDASLPLVGWIIIAGCISARIRIRH
jgi:hypothetical protein